MEKEIKNAKSSINETVAGTNESNNTNNGNAEKLAKLIKDAEKMTENYKETGAETDKQNAINAGKAVAAAMDVCKPETHIKVAGTWYQKSPLDADKWLTDDGLNKSDVEAKHGQLITLAVRFFAAEGYVLIDGQSTQAYFANVNGNNRSGWRTKTQLKADFGIATKPHGTANKNPNAALIKVLGTLANAIGLGWDSDDLDTMESTAAAALIKDKAAAMLADIYAAAAAAVADKKRAAAVAVLVAAGYSPEAAAAALDNVPK